MARLADTIVVSLGEEEIHLIPRLRHAMRLERRPGSFAQLSRGILDGSLTATCEIIRDHYDHPMLEARIFDSGLERMKWPLTAYLGQCLGLDPADLSEPAADDSKPPKDKPQTTADFLTGLYRIGTGWLGWSPADTLDATPAEIIEAQTGRMDMFKAIFGDGKKSTKQDSFAPFTDKNVAAAFRGLGATIVQPNKEVPK